MMKIPMVDLWGQYQRIKDQIDLAIQSVITSTSFINGPDVRLFAQELSEWMGVKHVIPCGNGTDAIQIALMALGLRTGDEVIVPVHTYAASAEVIALLKLKPVFVDVDPDTFTIDLANLEKIISHRTRAIIPVHLFGQCADMENLLEIAQKYNLKIIEDAAQAMGTHYFFSNGTSSYAGTMGEFGTTSFFPSKNLGCFGDGGALFTNSDVLAEKAQMIANHGQREKYHHEIVGCNSRLDSIQAAVLRVKLRYLKQYLEARSKVAAYYDKAFQNLDFLQVPVRADYCSHGFNQYTILVKGAGVATKSLRDILRNHLAQAGIATAIYYPIPLHMQKAYMLNGNPQERFPVAENLSKIGLSLPIHTEMGTKDVQYIVEVVKRTLTKISGYVENR